MQDLFRPEVSSPLDFPSAEWTTGIHLIILRNDPPSQQISTASTIWPASTLTLVPRPDLSGLCDYPEACMQGSPWRSLTMSSFLQCISKNWQKQFRKGSFLICASQAAGTHTSLRLSKALSQHKKAKRCWLSVHYQPGSEHAKKKCLIIYQSFVYIWRR